MAAQKTTKGLLSARDTLIAQADKDLKAGPFSVMHKKLTPASGDKHDYMSVGPYWWPDPKKPDGLPYIRRDGEVNPERYSDQTDSEEGHRVLNAVFTLELAYRETGKEAYAEKAASLLRTWYLDPAARMNPNLNFGQAVPGVSGGRPTGIIDTAAIADLVKGLAWLAKSAAWTKADQDGMKVWCGQYLDWLTTSKIGKGEGASKNNHGSWWDVQVVALATFTGKTEFAKEVVEKAKSRRIAVQIALDGCQPLELERTKALSYSTMNLRALFELAERGKELGVDLWTFETKDGRGLRKALDYLAPYVDPAAQWPHEQISGVKDANRLEIAALLRRGAIAYREPKYEAVVLKALPAELVAAQRMQLLWPAQ